MTPATPTGMTDADARARWHDANAAYLHEAVAAVVARLRKMADSYEPPPVPFPPEPPRGPCAILTRRGRRLRRMRRGVERPVRVDPVALASEVTRAEAAMDRVADEMGPWPPALARLVDEFGLTPLERGIITLCAAVELDTRAAALCARAQDDARKPFPTLALAMALFDDPEWTALSPTRPLLGSRMIEVHQPGVTPLASAALKLDERIMNYLRGDNHLDEGLAVMLTRVRPPLRTDGGAAEPCASQKGRVAEIVSAWIAAHERGEAPPVVHLIGPDASSNRLVALAAAGEAGRRLYAIEAKTLEGLLTARAGGSDLNTFSRLWEREAILMKIALYVDDESATAETSDAPSITPAPRGHHGGDAIAGLLAKAGTWTFVATREPGLRIDRPHVTVEVARPTPDEQVTAWAEALGFDLETLDPAIHRSLTGLASQYPLDPTAIHDIVDRVGRRRRRYDDATELIDDLWDECRARCRPRAHGLAQRIESRAGWRDLVLPERPTAQLHTIVEQVRHRHAVYHTWGFAEVLSRGMGLSVLFSGESGTGKTMAAEVIANELGVDLFRIDLSSVLSKYIGDIEKNLKAVFDAFEDSGAILFFDEADALYGKRTEIKDSHDRYANIAVNYLLQRIEAYRGLAILATNFKSALDPALSRRLRFVVEFPQPGQKERAEIWRRAFPSSTPLQDVDADRLARLPLNGGSIRVAALNAAFAAAAGGSPVVAMRHVVEASRDECLKLGRAIPASEFAPPRAVKVAAAPDWPGGAP